MTNDEELQALREENRLLKALVAELLPLKEPLAQANAFILPYTHEKIHYLLNRMGKRSFADSAKLWVKRQRRTQANKCMAEAYGSRTHRGPRRATPQPF